MNIILPFLPIWFLSGYILNIICYILLHDIIKFRHIIMSFILSFIGPFGFINIIGILMIHASDEIMFNKTFIKIQDKFFRYIYS